MVIHSFANHYGWISAWQAWPVAVQNFARFWQTFFWRLEKYMTHLCWFVGSSMPHVFDDLI